MLIAFSYHNCTGQRNGISKPARQILTGVFTDMEVILILQPSTTNLQFIFFSGLKIEPRVLHRLCHRAVSLNCVPGTCVCSLQICPLSLRTPLQQVLQSTLRRNLRLMGPWGTLGGFWPRIWAFCFPENHLSSTVQPLGVSLHSRFSLPGE